MARPLSLDRGLQELEALADAPVTTATTPFSLSGMRTSGMAWAVSRIMRARKLEGAPPPFRCFPPTSG